MRNSKKLKTLFVSNFARNRHVLFLKDGRERSNLVGIWGILWSHPQLSFHPRNRFIAT